MIGTTSEWNGLVDQTIPAYLYQEYQGDPNIQAFFDAYNQLVQQYLNWFNQVELPVWTAPLITGPLLDWVGQGIYGIPRPVFTSFSETSVGPVATFPVGTNPVAARTVSTSGAATIANDDYYKRCLTWALYKGDGQQFSVPWLKRRIWRFLNGPNGIAPPVQTTYPISVTCTATMFTITVPASPAATVLQEAIGNNVLTLPFQYQFTVNPQNQRLLGLFILGQSMLS